MDAVKLKLLAEVARGSPRHIRHLSNYSQTFRDADIRLIQSVLPLIAGGPEKPVNHYRKLFSTSVSADSQTFAALNSLKFISSFCALSVSQEISFDRIRTAGHLATHWDSIERWLSLFVTLDYSLATWSDLLVRVSLVDSSFKERLMKSTSTISLVINIFAASAPASTSRRSALEYHGVVTAMFYTALAHEEGLRTARKIMTSNINRSEDVITGILQRFKYMARAYPTDEICAAQAVNQIRNLYVTIKNAFLDIYPLDISPFFRLHETRIAHCFRLGTSVLRSVLLSDPPRPTDLATWHDVMQALNISAAWAFHRDQNPVKSICTLVKRNFMDVLLPALAHTPVRSQAHREGLANLELMGAFAIYRRIWTRIELRPPQNLPLEATLAIKALRSTLAVSRSLWHSAPELNGFCDHIEHDHHAAVSLRLRQCSKCRRVRYCSTECQIRDWDKHHKLECRAFQDQVGLPMSVKLELMSYLLKYTLASTEEPTFMTPRTRFARPEHRVIAIDHRFGQVGINLVCLQDYAEHIAEYPKCIAPRLETLLATPFSLPEIRTIHGIFNYGLRNAHAFIRMTWRDVDQRNPQVLAGLCFIHDVIDWRTTLTL